MKVKLNDVQLTGYIAENVYVNQDGTLLSFGLGVDDSYYKKGNGNNGEWVNRTSWVNCKVFDQNRIEKLKDRIQKCEVLVSGKLKTSKVEKDGETTYQTYVLAERIQIIADHKDGDGIPDDDNAINLSGIEDEELPFNS